MSTSDRLLIIMPDGAQVEISRSNQTTGLLPAPVSQAPAAPPIPKLFLSKERGRRLDAIRVINVVCEMGFILDEYGRKAMKKDVFQAAGIMLNVDFSNYSSDLSSSLADGTSMKKHLKIFEDMQEVMKNIFNLA